MSLSRVHTSAAGKLEMSLMHRRYVTYSVGHRFLWNTQKWHPYGLTIALAVAIVWLIYIQPQYSHSWLECSPLQTPRNWVLAELATVCECYICQQWAELVCATGLPSTDRLIIYFASGAVAVDSSHMTASSSTLWCRFSPPSNFVNGHVSTMWFMVCCWPQSQEGDWARPHLCKLARHGPWPVWKRFIRDHVWRGRSKPVCRIVGSVTVVWLSTEADDQSSLLNGVDRRHVWPYLVSRC